MAYGWGGSGGWYPQTSVWGSLGQGLPGVADAFWNVMRVKQAQDQKALENVQTLFKLYPDATSEQKQQWIGNYQQQIGKNKFWDKNAFQFPTQTHTQGQPNFMGPAAPPAPGPQQGGGPGGTPGPFVNPDPTMPGLLGVLKETSSFAPYILENPPALAHLDEDEYSVWFARISILFTMLSTLSNDKRDLETPRDGTHNGEA